MNILIVEDNKQMRRAIRDFLCGFVEGVYECEDGSEAFALYARHRPDWVLMDIQMKGMDGIIATQQIIAAFPNARIAIVTDYDDDDLREAAQRAGAREYFVKENLFALRRILTDGEVSPF
jgi:DNA-binding NarL/FixJ family response regulator